MRKTGCVIGADPYSLISAFVVLCLNGTTPIVALYTYSQLIASICDWADRFGSYLTTNLQRQVFSWGAHILQEESKKDFYSEDAGPKYVGYIENAIDTFGSNGYAASDSVSIDN